MSGLQQSAFICETETLVVGPALDANCSVNTRVEYFYRSTAVGAPTATGPPGGVLALLPGEAEAPGGRGAVPGGRGAGAGRGTQAANPWKPFDPAAPRPADLAMTTTTEGHTAP